MYDEALLREFSSILKTNLLQECQEDDCKSLIKAWWPLFKMPEWLIVAIKE